MFTPTPTSGFIYFTLTLLLLLSFFTSIMASEPVTNENDDADLDGIEELIALDEAEEQQKQDEGSHVRSSEAEVLSKAQRVVLELSNDNTKRVIDGNEFVLVLGYAPWCARSAELMPQFAEAAMSLKELGSTLLMGKLDAERYPKAASLLGIKGFPTLLLFVNGSSEVYSGGFSSQDIVIWTRKKTGVPVIRISSVAEAEEFLKKHHMLVIGLFEKFEGHEYEEFLKAATSDNEIQFVEVSNSESAKALFPDIKSNDKNFLGLVKSEPENYTTYEGTFRTDKILEFLDYNKFPLVNVLTEHNSLRVYSSPIKLQSLTVNNFYIGEGTDFSGVPTKMVTVNGTLKMSIYNPATLFGIHVSSTPVNLLYSEIPVAIGQLKKYYQPRKSRRTVSVILEGTKVPLYGAGSSLAVSNTNSKVPLSLDFEIRSRGDVVGKLVRTKHRKRISCPLVVDSTSTKPIKFKQDSCIYE